MRRSIIAFFLGLAQVPQSLMGLFAGNVSNLWVPTVVSHSLEGIQSLLPPAIAFDPDLDTPENHLLPAAEIYSQLDDVAVLELEWLALLIWLT